LSCLHFENVLLHTRDTHYGTCALQFALTGTWVTGTPGCILNTSGHSCPSHAAAYVWNGHIKLTGLLLQLKCMINLSVCLTPWKFWRLLLGCDAILYDRNWNLEKPCCLQLQMDCTTSYPTLNHSVYRTPPALAAIFNTLLLLQCYLIFISSLVYINK